MKKLAMKTKDTTTTAGLRMALIGLAVLVNNLVGSPEIWDNFQDEDGDGWISRNDYSIRTAHPRLLVTCDTLPAIIERVKGRDAHWIELMLQALQTPDTGLCQQHPAYLWAFAFLVTGNEEYGRKAVEMAPLQTDGEYAMTQILHALTYDWLLGADAYWNKHVFTDAASYAATYLVPFVGKEEYSMQEVTKIWYGPEYYYGSPHGQYDAFPQNGALAFVYANAFLTFALAGDGVADDRVAHILPMLRRYLEEIHIPDRNMFEGIYPSGTGRESYNTAQILYAIEAIRTATGINLFPRVEYARKYVLSRLYASVPHTVTFPNNLALPEYNIGRHEIFDTGLGENRLLRPFLSLLADRYQDPLIQWLYERSRLNGEVGMAFEVLPGVPTWSYSQFHFLHRFLHWNDQLPARSISESQLPLALYQGNYSKRHPEEPINPDYRKLHNDFTYLEGAGHVYMRSSWTDTNATFATFQCGDRLSREQHSDNLAFSIHRGGYLALACAFAHDGWWGDKPLPNQELWWSINSGHNIPLISDPRECYRSSNWPALTNRDSPNWQGQLAFGEKHAKTGEIKAFRHSTNYTFISADATMSYLSSNAFCTLPEWLLEATMMDHYKVNQVERDFVYLRSPSGKQDYFIVFDRIEETPQTFLQNGTNSSKRFVLFLENEPVVLTQTGWAQPSPGITEYRQSDSWSSLGAGLWPGSSANAKLLGKTLLPKSHKYRVVGGIGGDRIPATNLVRGTYLIDYWEGESTNYHGYNVIPYFDPIIQRTNLGLTIMPPAPAVSGLSGQNWSVEVNEDGLAFLYSGQVVKRVSFENCPTLEAVVTEINSWTKLALAYAGNDWAARLNVGYQFWLDDWDPGNWGSPMGGNAFMNQNLRRGIYGSNFAFRQGDDTEHYGYLADMRDYWPQVGGLWRVEVIPDGADIQPFNNFLHVLYPADAVSFVLDNKDDGFAKTGAWESIYHPLPNGGEGYRADWYFGRTFLYHGQAFVAKPGSGETTAKWTFRIDKEGDYEVAGWWNDWWDTRPKSMSYELATDAPFTVEHADGMTAVRVDQRHSIRRWQNIATVHLVPGQWSVQLANDANGWVMADALRVTQIAGDSHVSLPQTELLESENGEMKGAFIHDPISPWAVLFSAKGTKAIRAHYTIPAQPPGATVRHLVTGLQAGVYQISRAGVVGQGGLTQRNGVLYFESDRSGEFNILKTASVDEEAPTPPDNFQVVPDGHQQLRLSWTPSRDNDNPVTYCIYRDYIPLAETEETTLVDSAWDLHRRPTYQVLAIDSVGNESATTPPVAVSDMHLFWRIVSGRFEIGFYPQVGVKYRLQTSTNLLEWQDISSIETSLQEWSVQPVTQGKVAYYFRIQR